MEVINRSTYPQTRQGLSTNEIINTCLSVLGDRAFLFLVEADLERDEYDGDDEVDLDFLLRYWLLLLEEEEEEERLLFRYRRSVSDAPPPPPPTVVPLDCDNELRDRDELRRLRLEEIE